MAAGDIRRKVLRRPGGFAMLAVEAWRRSAPLVISSKHWAVKEFLQDLSAAEVFLIGISKLMTNQL